MAEAPRSQRRLERVSGGTSQPPPSLERFQALWVTLGSERRHIQEVVDLQTLAKMSLWATPNPRQTAGSDLRPLTPGLAARRNL